MNSLVAVSLVLITMLLSLIISKSNKLYADRFLIIYLFFSALNQVYQYIELTGLLNKNPLMLLFKGTFLLGAPLFFLYVYALTKGPIVPRWLYLIVFLPVVLYCLNYFYYSLFIFSSSKIEIRDGLMFVNGALSVPWFVFVVLFLTINPIYLFWFYILLRDYKNKLNTSTSNKEKIHLDWLNLLFYMWLLIAVVLVPLSSLTVGRTGFSNTTLKLAMEVANVFFFFVVGYYGFKQTSVFSNLELKSPALKETGKYERSGLSSADAKSYHQRLLTLMEQKKPYLNGDLNAAELAELLRISVNHLSQILNQEQHQNFFDFVNSYRVEEVKVKMKDERFSHLTLLALALESGFNSKSSFNTVFKKLTGEPPSKYLKSAGK